VWLCDATADKELLELGTGLDIQDATPEGRLELSKNVVQFPVDVTRKTSKNRFRDMLRGVLASRLDCHRVGIITHRPLKDAATSLGPLFDHRVAMVEHFGSGEDRASNRWQRAGCDLIVVAGTPRVDELEIKKLLHRVGQLDALNAGGDWGELPWQGFTTSGKRRIVKGRGYREATWRQVHRSKVRAAIIQAAGRARALLDTGCDAVILSSEECGFPVADVGQELVPLTDTEARVLTELKAVVSLILKRNNRLYAPTSEVADRSGISVRQARDILRRLELCGLVERESERSGWRLADAWNAGNATSGSSSNQKPAERE
jgi:hypothetical protein